MKMKMATSRNTVLRVRVSNKGLLDSGTNSTSGTWIDKDFTDGTLSAAFKFRANAYGRDVEDTFDNEEWCNATIFSEWSNAISGN